LLDNPAIALATIGILAFACQWLSWWVKLPAILFLLITGILIGPVFELLRPDDLFGDLLFPFISLAVAIVLFEGSLTLRFSEINGLGHVVRRLLSSGLLITWAVTTLATYWLLDLPIELAVLFGAVTVVTGPTVIVPMLRSVRPNTRVANILRWEGIVIDPIGALLAVLVFEFIVAGIGAEAFSHTAFIFLSQILTGLSIGAGTGYILGIAFRRHWIPSYLQNLATFCIVLASFAVSNEIQHESGLLTVTVMGIWLANMKGVHTEDILDFKESLSLLFISGLFIILAARLNLDEFLTLGWPALGVLIAIQFIARPLKVVTATWGSNLSWQERFVLGWIAPRGIIAAAISALFAIQLEQQGYEQATVLVPLTFMIIIGTVGFQSISAAPIARLLKVAEPEPTGFLFVGANPLARVIASALDEHGFKTMLADNNWDHIRTALVEGRKTFYGNVVSERADRRLELVGIGRLLAVWPYHETNCLAVMRYRNEFGRENTFSLPLDVDTEEERTKEPQCGRIAFGDKYGYSYLTQMLRQDAQVHSTDLTENFGLGDFDKLHGDRAVKLFAITPRGQLRIFTQTNEMQPSAGWKLISLILPSDEDMITS